MELAIAYLTSLADISIPPCKAEFFKVEDPLFLCDDACKTATRDSVWSAKPHFCKGSLKAVLEGPVL